MEGGMSVKPILFNTDMVRAILDGRKTVTRRLVKPRYGGSLEVYKDLAGVPRLCERCGTLNRGLRPPYQIGDILWVRETWISLVGSYLYRADQKPGMKNPGKWFPSIHMPKEAARIWLRVTDVRVERLQEIDEDGIRAEGLTSACVHAGDMEIAAQEFALLWDSTIKPAGLDRYGWAANPWVWVIAFERCEKPEEKKLKCCGLC